MIEVNLDLLKEDFKVDEGVRRVPYKDHLGNWTVGVGHLTSNPLSAKAINQILEDDIIDAIQSCIVLCHLKNINWEELPREVREVLIKMCFQLGSKSLRMFYNMWLGVQFADWKKMQIEMLDSKWAKVQTPERAIRTSKLLDSLIQERKEE